MEMVIHAEREFDYGELAAFTPANDGFDEFRMLSCFEAISQIQTDESEHSEQEDE